MVQAFTALILLNGAAIVFAALMNKFRLATAFARAAAVAYVATFIVLVGSAILLLPPL
jgi:hypothetical protein